jgi:hypothetical protein
VIAIDQILERMRWDGGSPPLFLRANFVAAKECRRAFEEGRNSIVEGNFYWKAAILDLARRVSVPTAIVTLKVPLRTCIRRDRERSYSYGEVATRQVFAKSERVKIGTKVDGRGTTALTVRRILARLRSGIDFEGRPPGLRSHPN